MGLVPEMGSGFEQLLNRYSCVFLCCSQNIPQKLKISKRLDRIELTLVAWKATVLPLNYRRSLKIENRNNSFTSTGDFPQAESGTYGK